MLQLVGYYYYKVKLERIKHNVEHLLIKTTDAQSVSTDTQSVS